MSDCFILLSAGKSKRFKLKLNKKFFFYKNKPLFEHSLKTALDSKLFKKVIKKHTERGSKGFGSTGT